jgi:hypothetical protein
MYLVGVTSAAKAAGFAGWNRRAEALLHPVAVGFTERQKLPLMNADKRGLGNKFRTRKCF